MKNVDTKFVESAYDLTPAIEIINIIVVAKKTYLKSFLKGKAK